MNVPNVEVKSNAWKDVIAEMCQALLPANQDVDDMPLSEQLLMLFDDHICETSEEKKFRALKSEYGLHVSIAGNDCNHLEPVLLNTLRLCDAVFARIPCSVTDTADYAVYLKTQVKLFKSRGERAKIRIFRNMNISVVEVTVQTTELACKEFLYWNKDKVYVMSFVPAFDAAPKTTGDETFVFV